MAGTAGELRISVADVPMDGMVEGADGDAKVLWVRDARGVRAFQATCPHYGAPLAKGAICGGTLYCPWHKAAFDVADGTLREPPALNHLIRYPVRVEDGQAVATLVPVERPRPEPSGAGRHLAIVGTGAAAVACATVLRREGFAGRVTMIAREDGQPYDRCKLSKNFMAKRTPPESMFIEKDFFAALDVDEVRKPARVIDVARRRVTLADGQVIEPDALLVATGSRAARPSFPGDTLANVFTLRSLADAMAISDAAEKAQRVVAVGGGFIGLEAAAFLAKRGLEATVVSPEALPLAARFGDAVAAAIKAHHEAHGLRFIQGKVARFAGEGRVGAVHLEDGGIIDADLVLIAAGASPETGTLEGVSLREDGGVPVGGDLQIAPGVWAAGDIAAFPDVRTGRIARIEHWRLAEQHGIHVAHAVLGREGAFTNAPFFWSNQGDKRVDYAGYAPEWDEIVTVGDIAALDFIAYYVKDGVAHAACAIGQAARMVAFLNRLESGPPPSRADVAAA